MAGNKKVPTRKDLRDKKIDIVFLVITTLGMLGLAIDFGVEAKSDSHPRVMKALAITCAFGTAVGAANTAKCLYDYNDIKTQLANKANEKHK